MPEWDILVEGAAGDDGVVNMDTAETILTAIEPFGGSVSFHSPKISVRLTVEAGDAQAALEIASAVINGTQLFPTWTHIAVEPPETSKVPTPSPRRRANRAVAKDLVAV